MSSWVNVRLIKIRSNFRYIIPSGKFLSSCVHNFALTSVRVEIDLHFDISIFFSKSIAYFYWQRNIHSFVRSSSRPRKCLSWLSSFIWKWIDKFSIVRRISSLSSSIRIKSFTYTNIVTNFHSLSYMNKLEFICAIE